MAGVICLPESSSTELQSRCADLAELTGCESDQHYRCQSEAPLRKLTVDLIKTYRKINDVCEIYIFVRTFILCVYMCVNMHTIKVETLEATSTESL